MYASENPSKTETLNDARISSRNREECEKTRTICARDNVLICKQTLGSTNETSP
jgi:hypothetical protein